MPLLAAFGLTLAIGCSPDYRPFCERKCECEPCEVAQCMRFEEEIRESQGECSALGDALRDCITEHGRCSPVTDTAAYFMPSESCMAIYRERDACLAQRSGGTVAEEVESRAPR